MPGGMLSEKVDDFRRFYEQFGFVHFQSGSTPMQPSACAVDVAIYTRAGLVRHVALRKGFGPWTSKLGEGPTIEHALADLEDGIYGKVTAFARRFAQL